MFEYRNPGAHVSSGSMSLEGAEKAQGMLIAAAAALLDLAEQPVSDAMLAEVHGKLAEVGALLTALEGEAAEA